MIKKITIRILAAIGLFYIVFVSYVSVFDDCHTQIKGVATSPDGVYMANYYQKYCEGKPTIINIWLGKQDSTTGTQIFSSIATTTEKIHLVWKKEKELHVIYPEFLVPTTTNNSFENVNIKFKAIKKK